MRKMVEPGARSRSARADPRTDRSSVASTTTTTLRRYVIPHEELFLGHFGYTPRLKRNVITLTKESALGNFEERLEPCRRRRRSPRRSAA